MSNELETKLADIQEISKKDPSVNATALMITALEQEHKDQSEIKHKRWAYLVSIGLPPLGYILAIYYRFFSAKKDGINLAWWCAGLTTFSILVSYITLQIILGAATQSSGQQFNFKQFQQTPTELRQVVQ